MSAVHVDQRKRSGRFLSCVGAAVLALFSLGLSASSEAKEPLTVQELMQLVGLETVFDGLEQQLAVDQNPNIKALAEADPKFAEAWESAAQGSFVGAELRKTLVTQLTGALNPTEQQQLKDLYGSGIGKKATDLERAAQSPQGRQQMVKNAASIMAELGKQPDRQAMYTKLENSLNMVETSTDVAMNVALTMTIGMTTVRTSDIKPSAEDLKQLLEQQRPAMATAIKQYLQLAIAHTYQSMSVEELGSYQALLQRDVVKKLYAKLKTAMSVALSKASLEFGQKLARNLNVEPI